MGVGGDGKRVEDLVSEQLRKIHEAKQRSKQQFTLWGSGHPRREFLCSDDLGEASVFLMNLSEGEFGKLVAPETAPLANLGTGKDLTIAESPGLIAEAVGYDGCFVYDAPKPDSTPRKVLDSACIMSLGWKPGVDLRRGIALAYQAFLKRYAGATCVHTCA